MSEGQARRRDVLVRGSVFRSQRGFSPRPRGVRRAERHGERERPTGGCLSGKINACRRRQRSFSLPPPTAEWQTASRRAHEPANHYTAVPPSPSPARLGSPSATPSVLSFAGSTLPTTGTNATPCFVVCQWLMPNPGSTLSPAGANKLYYFYHGREPTGRLAARSLGITRIPLPNWHSRSVSQFNTHTHTHT